MPDEIDAREPAQAGHSSRDPLCPLAQHSTARVVSRQCIDPHATERKRAARIDRDLLSIHAEQFAVIAPAHQRNAQRLAFDPCFERRVGIAAASLGRVGLRVGEPDVNARGHAARAVVRLDHPAPGLGRCIERKRRQ